MEMNVALVKTTLKNSQCHCEFIKLTVIPNVFLTHVLEKNSNFEKIIQTSTMSSSTLLENKFKI